MQFLRAVCGAVRKQVGPEYPVLIKLGMMDGVEGGLTPEEGVRVVAVLEEMSLDGVEISGGIGGGRALNTRTGIRSEADEAYRAVRSAIEGGEGECGHRSFLRAATHRYAGAMAIRDRFRNGQAQA